MHRVRLLLSFGVVLLIVGIALVAVALTWLAANWGAGNHLYDPNGPLYKHVAMARLGLTCGIVAALGGLALSAIGLALRQRQR